MVLVVDDSMLIRHTICRFLEERGYAVESVSNGEEALEVLNSVLPDLIFTDLTMPKMDGHELITRLKSRPLTAQIPVVVLSARRNKGEREEDRGNFRIYKDIDIDQQLERALRTLLAKDSSQLQRPSAASA